MVLMFVKKKKVFQKYKTQNFRPANVHGAGYFYLICLKMSGIALRVSPHFQRELVGLDSVLLLMQTKSPKSPNLFHSVSFSSSSPAPCLLVCR